MPIQQDRALKAGTVLCCDYQRLLQVEPGLGTSSCRSPPPCGCHCCRISLSSSTILSVFKHFPHSCDCLPLPLSGTPPPRPPLTCPSLLALPPPWRRLQPFYIASPRRLAGAVGTMGFWQVLPFPQPLGNWGQLPKTLLLAQAPSAQTQAFSMAAGKATIVSI